MRVRRACRIGTAVLTAPRLGTAPPPRAAGGQEGPTLSQPRILYLAHDLDDPAIGRRVRMLERGGALVELAGFRRDEGALERPALVLGRTEDGRLGRRALSVLGTCLRPPQELAGRPRPDANPGAQPRDARRGRARPGRLGAARPRLAYESLDVHRSLVGTGARPRALRAVERRLARGADLVLTSSPGFAREHFGPQSLAGRLRIVENKLLLDGSPPAPPPLPVAPPVTVGWFGVLRCRWSLHALDRATRAAPGRLKVTLRGRPALDAVPDLPAVVAANPDMELGGPYRYPDDLPAIYGAVALTWMVDRFDAGANSDWLLPNRLYEGGAFGRVPVALAGTEVAAALDRLGIGLRLPAAEEGAVAALLLGLDAARIEEEAARVRALPPSTFVTDDAACRALVSGLLGAA
jgi:succinoglycan biosynthesis protein ExoL